MFFGGQIPASGSESLVYVRHRGRNRCSDRKPSPARHPRELTADSAQELLPFHCEDVERAKKVSHFHCHILTKFFPALVRGAAYLFHQNYTHLLPDILVKRIELFVEVQELTNVVTPG